MRVHVLFPVIAIPLILRVVAEKNAIERQTASYANEQRVMAEAEAENFGKRLVQYRRLGRDNPYFLNGIYEQLHAAMWIGVVVNWVPELAALIALIAALGLVLAAPRLLRAVR